MVLQGHGSWHERTVREIVALARRERSRVERVRMVVAQRAAALPLASTATALAPDASHPHLTAKFAPSLPKGERDQRRKEIGKKLKGMRDSLIGARTFVSLHIYRKRTCSHTQLHTAEDKAEFPRMDVWCVITCTSTSKSHAIKTDLYTLTSDRIVYVCSHS